MEKPYQVLKETDYGRLELRVDRLDTSRLRDSILTSEQTMLISHPKKKKSA